MMAVKLKQGLILLKIIGKWSMTDVFVGAILLSFFKGADKLTHAVLQGFYFFLAYCLISIKVFHDILKHQEEVKFKKQG